MVNQGGGYYMTQQEIAICEHLLIDAIKTARKAHEEFIILRILFTEDNMYECELNQRKSDRHWGHAEGIFKALTELKFTHERLEELKKLIEW